MRSLDCELESALLHLIQAEDRAAMYHYPEEIREAIKRLKIATYRVRGFAQKFRQANSAQAFREATNGVEPTGGYAQATPRGGESTVAVAPAVKEQPAQGGRASEVTPAAREVSPASLRDSSGTIPAVEHHPTTSASGAADGSLRGPHKLSDATPVGGQTSPV